MKAYMVMTYWNLNFFQSVKYLLLIRELASLALYIWLLIMPQQKQLIDITYKTLHLLGLRSHKSALISFLVKIHFAFLQKLQLHS